jgi:hypothetical protein
VELVDEHDDEGSGVDPPDADVVELAVHAQGDRPGLVDSVSTHPIVGSGCAAVGVEDSASERWGRRSL